MKYIVLLISIFAADLSLASPISVAKAVDDIQFCTEVTSEAEALNKALLGDKLVNPNLCSKRNQWNLTLHQRLIQQGYTLDRFIPAYYLANSKQQRLEIFLWYTNSKTGQQQTFQNSCELSEAAKLYIQTHPQPTC